MASSTTTPLPSNEEKCFPICLCAVNVSNFVTSKLGGDKQSNNYSSWKQQMLCFIESHDLLRFIDDSPKGTVTKDDKYIAFRKSDMLLKGWILGTLSDAVLNTVTNSSCATAKDVWLELEKNFISQSAADTLEQKEYWPLYKAIRQGDWDAVKEIVDKDPHTSKARINSSKQTALHVAIATGKAHHFVEKLVALMPDDESVALKDDNGNTALSIAAAVGNKEAKTTLLNRMPDLLYISNNKGDFPVQQAALFANRDMLRDLISLTKDDLGINPYAGIDGLRLLIYAIDVEFLDVALYLVENYPHVATLKLPDGTSALKKIAAKRSLFKNSADLKPLALRMIAAKRSPFDNSTDFFTLFCGFSSYLIKLFGTLEETTPAKPDISDVEKMANDAHPGVLDAILTEASVHKIKEIEGRRLLIQQARQLTKCLCEKMGSMSQKLAADIYVDAILMATELGSNVVIEQIVEAFPDAIYCSTPSFRQSILHIAAQNRSADVFNLIHQKGSGHKYFHLDTIDSDGNNLLHAAAKLAPSHKLDEVSGAALQMEREIKWYKMMERIVHPNCTDQPNKFGKTPKTVFKEEHKKLKEEAEKWTKDIANSCMVAAALIAGVAFAGVITVPGGYNSSSGFPIFSKKAAFSIYALSNLMSLYMATVCLFVLLCILLSRYADEDFLLGIPAKIRVSLLALFISVAFMIISSYTALFLIFTERGKARFSVGQTALTSSIVLAQMVLSILLMKFGPLRHYFLGTAGYGIISIH